MWVLVLQRMALEFIIDLIYFPLWWYSSGAKGALIFCINLIKEANANLAPGLWLKNIFVPMFGQWDWQGRIMSFFMRSVNVVFRTIGLLIWVAIMVVVFLLWLAFPGFVVYMLLISVFKI